jgi:hypothetical protein
VSQVDEPLIFTGTAPFSVSGKVSSAAGLAVGGITITFTSQQDGAPPSPATTKADGT